MDEEGAAVAAAAAAAAAVEAAYSAAKPTDSPSEIGEIFQKIDTISSIPQTRWKEECNCIQEDNIFPYPAKEGKVISVYKSDFDGTELYFIETDNYIFILDKVNDITGGGEFDYGPGVGTITIPKFILTSNEYPGCITLIVDKRTKILSVKFITMKGGCTFRAQDSKEKSLLKIFSKIHTALIQTDFKGKMELEDDAKFGNGVEYVI